MKSKFLFALLICAIAVLVIQAAIAVGKPLYPPGYEPKTGDEKTGQKSAEDVDLSALKPYKRVGVIQFDELGKKKTGADKFHSILLGRLKNAQSETEFISIDPKLDKDTPLMGETARQLGDSYKIDAIMTGVFTVKVQGGLYPTRANNVPAGKIGIDCRIIETESGWSRGKATIAWDKNKIYPQTIRTQKDLEGKLMRDGIEDLIGELKKTGFLSHAPLYTAKIEEQEFKEFAESICSTVRSAEAAYYAQHGYYGDFTALFEKGFLGDWFAAGGTSIENFADRKAIKVNIFVDAGGQGFTFDIFGPGAGTWILDQSGEIVHEAD